MRRANSKPGFTLVELLVVIGIIALLISILLPTLNKARSSALKTQDLSNIRQMAIFATMYASENKGNYPTGTRITGPYSDDLCYLFPGAFDVFLQYETGKSGITAATTVGTTQAALNPDYQRVLGCNAVTTNEVLTDQLFNPVYYNWAPTWREIQFGWIYMGGRTETDSTVTRLDGTVETNPYVYPLKGSTHATSRTLFTCFTQATSNYGSFIPHLKGAGYTGGQPGNSPTPFAFASKMQGLCMSYTDGSARFVTPGDFSVVTTSGDWYFFDQTAR